MKPQNDYVLIKKDITSMIKSFYFKWLQKIINKRKEIKMIRAGINTIEHNVCKLSKNLFFWKTQCTNPAQELIKKKEKAQMINIRKSKYGIITTDPTDIKMIIEENKRILCL